jgi:osmotically-inducible protein OsmY
MNERYGREQNRDNEYGSRRGDWSSRRSQYRQSDQYGQGGASSRAAGDQYAYGRAQYGSVASGYGHGWQGGENVGDRWIDAQMLEQPKHGLSSQGSGRAYNEGRDYSAQRQGGYAGKGPKGYTRSDERIREDVCERLSDDDEVDASGVAVSVKAGEVVLEGSVSDRRARRRAEDIADAVAGVKDVRNALRVQKGFLEEVGDRISGRRTEQHGHRGSGTRNG